MKDVRPEPPLLRTSERGDFKRCPWMWQQRWLNGLTPLREPTWALFGKAYHRALEVYYPVGRKRGSVADACDMFLQELEDQGRKVGVDIEDLEEAERMKAEAKGKDVKLYPARELGPEMLRSYHEFYEGDRQWEVIHTEQTFQIDVPDPDYEGETIVVYAGTWDALMVHIPTKRLWLWDHKTAKTIPSPGYLDLNDQAGTYPWVAKEVLVHKGILTKKDRIAGIVFSYSKKSPPDGRPKNKAGESLNKDGSVSAKQPAKRFERYESPRSAEQNVRQAQRVQDEAVVIEMARNNEIPILKNTAHDCERCVLFDLCQLHEAGEDWEFYRDQMFRHRDPYADHREDMERNGIEL